MITFLPIHVAAACRARRPRRADSASESQRSRARARRRRFIHAGGSTETVGPLSPHTRHRAFASRCTFTKRLMDMSVALAGVASDFTQKHFMQVGRSVMSAVTRTLALGIRDQPHESQPARSTRFARRSAPPGFPSNSSVASRSIRSARTTRIARSMTLQGNQGIGSSLRRLLQLAPAGPSL